MPAQRNPNATLLGSETVGFGTTGYSGWLSFGLRFLARVKCSLKKGSCKVQFKGKPVGLPRSAFLSPLFV